ncbi:MAG: hypothetical protein P1V36_07375 [Planctomycetota bacterium]|nr:hypothetical protein [Planctomycetota bacterium]
MRLLSIALLAVLLALPTAVVLVTFPASEATAAPSARDIALVRTLRKQRLTKVQFKETSLKGVVKWLRVATGKNIMIKSAALAKADIEWKDLTYTVQLENVSVWTFLDAVVAKPHGMAVTVKGNIVFLTSKADSYGKPVARMYSISHITWTKTDFYGPSINLNPSGFVEDEYEPEKVVEDDPLNNGDAVAELLKELLLPAQWESQDDWSVKATDRYLVIRAPKAVHNLVPRTLGKIAAMK